MRYPIWIGLAVLGLGCGDDGASADAGPDSGGSGTGACALQWSSGETSVDFCVASLEAEHCAAWAGALEGATHQHHPGADCAAVGYPVACPDTRFYRERCPGGDLRGFYELCASDAECGEGLACLRLFGNPANEPRCLERCAQHSDCTGRTQPGFSTPWLACWSCDDPGYGGPPAPGEAHCVVPLVCGAQPSPVACNQCLASCRGLPGCCTGTGCLCDAECP